MSNMVTVLLPVAHKGLGTLEMVVVGREGGGGGGGGAYIHKFCSRIDF